MFKKVVDGVICLFLAFNVLVLFGGWKPFKIEDPGLFRLFPHYHHSLKMRNDESIEMLSEAYYSALSGNIVILVLSMSFYLLIGVIREFNLGFGVNANDPMTDELNLDNQTDEKKMIRNPLGSFLFLLLMFVSAILYPNPKGTGWLEAIIMIACFVTSTLGVSVYLLTRSPYKKRTTTR